MASFGKSFGASFARVPYGAIGYAEIIVTGSGTGHFEAAGTQTLSLPFISALAVTYAPAIESETVVPVPVPVQPKVGGGVPIVMPDYLRQLLRRKEITGKGYAEIVLTGIGIAHYADPVIVGSFKGRGSAVLLMDARARGAYVNVERDDEEFFQLAA